MSDLIETAGSVVCRPVSVPAGRHVAFTLSR